MNLGHEGSLMGEVGDLPEQVCAPWIGSYLSQRDQCFEPLQ